MGGKKPNLVTTVGFKKVLETFHFTALQWSVENEDDLHFWNKNKN